MYIATYIYRHYIPMHSLAGPCMSSQHYKLLCIYICSSNSYLSAIHGQLHSVQYLASIYPVRYYHSTYIYIYQCIQLYTIYIDIQVQQEACSIQYSIYKIRIYYTIQIVILDSYRAEICDMRYQYQYTQKYTNRYYQYYQLRISISISQWYSQLYIYYIYHIYTQLRYTIYYNIQEKTYIIYSYLSI